MAYDLEIYREQCTIKAVSYDVLTAYCKGYVLRRGVL